MNMTKTLNWIVSHLTGQAFNQYFWGQIIKAGVDLIGGQSATQRQNDAARFAAQEAQMQPYNIYSGMGAVQFDQPFSTNYSTYNPYGGYGGLSSFFGGGGYGKPMSPTGGYGTGTYGQPAGQAPTPAQTGWGRPSFQGTQAPTTAGGPQLSNLFTQGGVQPQYDYSTGGPGTQSTATPAEPWDRFAYQKERLYDPESGIKGSFKPFEELERSWEIFGGPPMDTSPIPWKDPRNISTSLDPRLQGISNYLLSSGQQLLDVPIGGARNVGGYSGMGLPQFGMAQGAASPFFSAAAQEAGRRPGSPFFSQLQADPYDIAGTEFEKMEAVLEPARQRQREAIESRLLSQGRLGSTGGSLQQQSFEEAVGQQQRENLASALQTGMQTGQYQYGLGAGLEGLSQQRAGQLAGLGRGIGGFFGGLGTQLSGLGTNIRGQDIGLRSQDIARRAQDIGLSQSGLQRLLAGLQFEQSPLELARLSAGFSGMMTPAEASSNLFTAGQNAADATAGAYSSIGEGVGGLFNRGGGGGTSGGDDWASEGYFTDDANDFIYS